MLEREIKEAQNYIQLVKKMKEMDVEMETVLQENQDVDVQSAPDNEDDNEGWEAVSIFAWMYFGVCFQPCCVYARVHMIHVCVCVCVCRCTHDICTCIYIYIYIYTYIYIYICMYIYIYIYIHTCMHAYYTHTHTYTRTCMNTGRKINR
jgi:hypothetical protein